MQKVDVNIIFERNLSKYENFSRAFTFAFVFELIFEALIGQCGDIWDADKSNANAKVDA
jgi:hypothetical protein